MVGVAAGRGGTGEEGDVEALSIFITYRSVLEWNFLLIKIWAQKGELQRGMGTKMNL